MRRRRSPGTRVDGGPLIALAFVARHSGVNLMIGEADRLDQLGVMVLEEARDQLDHRVGRALVLAGFLERGVDGANHD